MPVCNETYMALQDAKREVEKERDYWKAQCARLIKIYQVDDSAYDPEKKVNLVMK